MFFNCWFIFRKEFFLDIIAKHGQEPFLPEKMMAMMFPSASVVVILLDLHHILHGMFCSLR